jgi:hypothetical protein
MSFYADDVHDFRTLIRSLNTFLGIPDEAL